MNRAIFLPLAALTASLAMPLAAQTQPPALSAEDLATLPRLGATAVNEAGTLMIYAVRETDRTDFSRTTRYFLHDLAKPDTPAVALDLGGASDVQFAPDGRITFVSERAGDDLSAGIARIWSARLGRDGALTAIRLVADFGDVPIGGYRLSPDGNRLAVWGDLPRTCSDFSCDRDTRSYLPGPGSGRLYDGADGFYRHWDEWETPGTFGRVFVYPVVDGRVDGQPIALDGPAGEGALTGDTPTKPFGGAEEIAWAPDGAGLYFVARSADADEPRSTNTDIYFSDLSDGRPRNVTQANQATDTLPAPSPNGRWLAYAAMERPGYESDRMVIHLTDLQTGQTRALTQAFDRSFGTIAWTPDSRHIVATAQDVLDTPAFRIDPRTGDVERLDLLPGNEAHIGTLMPLPGGRLLFTRDSIAAAPEIFLSDGSGPARSLTDVATSRLLRLAPVATQRFSFAGANGDEVFGQITKLADYPGKLPVILYVHGGPQGSFNDSWSTRWNPRVVASQGYAVVSIDFHGSTGYGQAFTDAINRDWGGKPLEDLQKGLAAALERDSQIDGERACAMGASYGGYMMNWIAGNWADRFDCLVQHDGLFDLRSFYYTTEELWFPRWDFGGSYAENSKLYERWNPVNYVENWQTPMLVIAGERDFRVPYTQGLASFTALQEQNVPAKLLVFPDENHWVLDPRNSVQWHETVFAWLDRWLTDEGAAAAR